MEIISYDMFVDISLYFTLIVDLTSLSLTNKKFNVWIKKLWHDSSYISRSIREIELSSRYKFKIDRNLFFQEVCEENHVILAKILLRDYWFNLNFDYGRAIKYALRNSYDELVEMLLTDAKAYNWNDNNNVDIIASSDNGNAKIVKLLLKHVDPTICDNAPIRMAAKNGHIDIVKLLLSDPRVNPEDNDNEAVRFASENGHTEIVDLLSKHQHKYKCGCTLF